MGITSTKVQVNTLITQSMLSAELRVPVRCTAATRPASPLSGDEIYETDTFKTLQYDGTSWWTTSIPGMLTFSSLPTITQVGTVTRTVTYSEYRIINGVCEWWFKLDIIAGTAGTAGTMFTISTPVNMKIGQSPGMTLGNGMIYDASAITIDTGHYEFITGTTIALSVSEGSNASWGANPSIGLSTSDSIRGHVHFLVATAG